MITVASCPHDPNELVGLVFDLAAQFHRALELDEKQGELVPSGSDGGGGGKSSARWGWN